MATLLRVNVDNPDELLTLFGAGALIRWESSADNDSWTEGGTEAIVSGTTAYVIEHLAGGDATYYRTRYSAATPSVPTDYSGYSDTWQASAIEGYATLHDVLETMALGSDQGRHNLILDLIADVSEDIDTACGRSFRRVPQVSGTTTLYFDIRHPGSRSLVQAIGHPYSTTGVPLDIVSVTTLRYRDSETGSYATIAAGDLGYYLDGGSGPGIAGTDWPFEDIILSPASTTITRWPTCYRGVEVVGTFGFPSVPRSVKRAVVSEVRERFRQSIGGGPSQAGINQFGTPIFLTGDSPDMRRIMKAGSPYLKRTWASV